MTRKYPTILAAIALSNAIAFSATAEESSLDRLKERERKVKKVVRDVMPATVAINGARQPASGSGVIINKEGLILTAAHVTAAAGEDLLVIFPDGRTVKAVSLGANSSRDAGMAKITEKGDWPYVKMADPKSVKLGEWVVALGHPGGYDPNRTPPVRLGRVWTKGFMGMLGSDCTLVGGDSGGPLLDLDGKLIGIHSSIGGQLSENRHVPMDAFNDDWEDLLAGKMWGSQGIMMGQVDPDRPALGVQLDPESRDGVRVVRLSEGSPAGKAGIKVGDIIRKVGEREVGEYGQMVKVLEKLKVGQEIAIVVEREGAKKEFKVKLGRLGKLWDSDRRQRGEEQGTPQEDPEATKARPSLGVNLNGEADEAEIYDVLPDSPAAKGGLKAGDIVLEIDGEKVADSAAMAESISGRSPGDLLKLLVRRGEEEREFEIELGEAK